MALKLTVISLLLNSLISLLVVHVLEEQMAEFCTFHVRMSFPSICKLISS